MLSVIPPVALTGVFYGRFVRGLSKLAQDAVAKSTDLGLFFVFCFLFCFVLFFVLIGFYLFFSLLYFYLCIYLFIFKASERIGALRTVRMFGQDPVEVSRYKFFFF